ncbi:MAG: hypothetical protein K2N78_01300 [Oscillospiraceae bacterium]|nr:hypothetical protein [Oscillospiraceae bacterium]
MSEVLMLVSDTPLEEVPPPAGLEIVLDLGKRETEYRNTGRGFAIFASDRVLELQTEKECFFGRDLYGVEEALAAYLREQLETAGEIELWHVWLDGSFDHRVRKVGISGDELTAEDIRELERLKVRQEDPVTGRPTDYCYLLTE